MTQGIGLRAPNAGGRGSIPGQGTRSHMHAATESSSAPTKAPEPQPRPRAANKTPLNHINTFF